MKIRGKVLALLLVTALIPLLVSALLHEASMRRLGKELAERSRSAANEDARTLLLNLADDYGRILARDRRALEMAVRAQAREVEVRLAGTALPRKVYYSADYGSAGLAIPGLRPSETHVRTGRDGAVEPVPVTYDEQVYFIVKGIAPQAVAEDVARLATMPEAYRHIHDSAPELMYWQYTALDSGIHTSYPGHGGYPESYDPRVRDWYTRARDAGRLIWHVMPEVSSRTVTQVVAMPVTRPDGEFAGVTAIDVPFRSMYRELRLPAAWSAGAEAMLAVLAGEGGPPTILVQRDYEALGSNWTAPVALARLTADDPAALDRLLREASSGRAAVVQIPKGGRPALWACGAVTAGEPFPVVIVPYDRVVAGAAAAERQVIERTVRELRQTGLVLLAVAFVAAIVALMVSRSVTGPVRRLADAAGRLAKGEYDARVSVKGKDEFAELGRTFNAVGPQLRERESLKASLAVAMEIQQKLLPQDAPELEGFEVAGRTVYCDETGGDYYDFIDLSRVAPGRLGIAVGDVSGHGIGAALLMASARGVLRSHAEQYGDDLGRVLRALNLYLVRDSSDERFMTLFYAVIDARERTLEWTSGGHDPALWLQRAGSEIEELANTGMPVGMIEQADYGQGGPIKLEEGDVVIVGTDGIWEARGPDGEMFGKQRLRELLAAMKDRSAAEIRSGIVAAVNEFKSTAPQLDDITVVVIRAVRAPAPPAVAPADGFR